MIDTSQSPKNLLRRIIPIAMLVLASGSLHAQQAISISLRGTAEVPSVTTSASGTGQITVRPDRTVSGTIRTTGMVPTMAHIHEAPVGRNGPPIVTLTKTADDSFAVPADAKLTEAQYTSYLDGNLYVNVHSAAYPNGELRAQLLRTEATGSAMRPAY